MSRRHNRAGRVTPKGGNQRRRSGSTAVAVPPEVDELLPSFDDDLDLFNDASASSFVSMCASASMSEFAGHAHDPEQPSRATIIDLLASFGSPAPRRVIDILAAMAVYGGDEADLAQSALRRLRPSPSPSTTIFGQGRCTAVWRMADPFAEIEQFLIEVTYPTGGTGVVGVMMDHVLGGMIKDALIAPSVEMVRDAVAAMTDIVIEPWSPSEAAALIDAGYSHNDRLEGIEEFVDDDVTALRPLIGSVLTDVVRVPRAAVELDAEDRSSLAENCVAWARNHDPAIVDTLEAHANLIVGILADRDLAILRVGPMTALFVLQWASSHVLAEPTELASLPDAMCGYVRFAHDRAGLGAHLTDQVLHAIDDALGSWEEVIEARQSSPAGMLIEHALAGVDLDDPAAVRNAVAVFFADQQGLLSDEDWVPPATGTHPEPLDSDRCGPSRERCAAIASMASVLVRSIFDDEYVTLVHRIIADAAAGHPDLFARGHLDLWASGAVYAIAQLNGIIDGASILCVSASELASRLPGAPGTITSKAAAIRAAVGVDRWSDPPRYAHRLSFVYPEDIAAMILPDLLGERDMDGLDPLDELHDRRSPAPEGSAFVLRLELLGLGSWRRVLLPTSATLYDLHRAIQLVFDWYDDHLHEFTIGERTYMTDADLMGRSDAIDEYSVSLCDVVRPSAVFTYTYDFGDNWEIEVTVEDQLAPDPDRRVVDLLDGVGDSPPEDCGGVWGFRHLVEVLDDPDHPEYDELVEWAGDFRRGGFDVNATATNLRRAAGLS